MTHINSYLLRCVELAEEALTAGDAPFGSVLVDEYGRVLKEDRNRVNSVDKTYHPEIELARWAAQNLSSKQRQNTIMYTSGEHCPMCSAAHGWAGLGRVVFIHSTQHLVRWYQEFGRNHSRVNQLPFNSVVPEIQVDGPVEELLPRMYELHKRHVESE
ncbi:nucleoside deaminase [Idiomarina sp. PL1-037]|uniref:nucleoside deaminase n=1 Tax=Idiomarina TaxID=135575 RepID=UPI00294ADAEA|nr:MULTISPECIES: nucleoside deaminase [unclassified Idiomarina]MDV6327813.1 nucleoside deaminase [Idiomarina sp. Sol25]WQC52928.1 nucleoside deaminase [Idiomarina sp. PL1-037]